MIDPFHFYEYSAVLHVHSKFSDGTGAVPAIIQAAEDADADVLILTDHDTLAARANPGEGYFGRLLFLVGAEVTPPQNHLLTLFTPVLPKASEPWAEIVATVAEYGGLSFVAHPVDPGSRLLKLPSYRWTERDVRGFTGLEIWNHLSSWLPAVRNVLTGLRAAMSPWWRLSGPPGAGLQLWDELGQEAPVVGVGGVDAHAIRVGFRYFGLSVFSYFKSFRTIRTQIYLSEALSYHDLDHDKELIYEALKNGRAAVLSCREGMEKGFRLWAAAPDALWPMGSTLVWRAGLRLKGSSPVLVFWRVLCDGRVVAESEGLISDVAIHQPGVWRVELIRGRSQRPWILSNPVYVRRPQS